jgi:hypothetical protein
MRLTCNAILLRNQSRERGCEMAGNPNAYCYCHTCGRTISSMGIARHRSMHRERREICVIEYSGGNVLQHDYSEKKRKPTTRKG